MTTPATNPSDNPAGGSPEEAAAKPALPIEAQLFAFWEKYRRPILVLVVAVLLAILGREAIGVLAARREAGIRENYAAATTSEEKRAFAQAHSGHELAGLAYLSLADEAYEAGNYAEAAADYEKAAGALEGTPFAGRVALGRAVALAQQGEREQATSVLNQIASDTSLMQPVRFEAKYHAAVLAADGGEAERARLLLDEIVQTDASGIWAQRALSFRLTLPPAAAPASEEAATEAAPQS